MKCLSLYQPWASLLVGGEKLVETRSWPIRFRGPLLIHAAKRWTPDEGMIAAGPVFRAALKRLGFGVEANEAKARAGWGLPFGAIVGRVDVIDCLATKSVRDGLYQQADIKSGTDNSGEAWKVLDINLKEREFGDYSPRRFAFLCANAVRFDTPIPFRGSQGLFDVPDATVAGEVPAYFQAVSVPGVVYGG